MGKDSIHSGHRERLKKAMLESNFNGMSDINLLEAVLFYSIARSDTNEIAHRLLQAFGSINAVFEADYDDLKQIHGVGDKSAFLIKLIGKTAKRIHTVDTTKMVPAKTTNDIAQIVYPYFIGEKDEKMVAVYVDSNSHLIRSEVIGDGIVNSVTFDKRRLMEGAIRSNCVTVFLAHNHPHGVPNPSHEDLRLTLAVREMLRTIDVCLYDHLIYAEGHWRCVSEQDNAAKYLSVLERKKREQEQ